MRYAIFPGGKRLRPALVVLGHQVGGGRLPEIYELSACLEFVHAFTLIHDDLPCMDDDDWRRGRPSCHRAFDEATAVLAGDALLNLSYQTLARASLSPARRERLLTTLAGAVGTAGVLGGQMEDLLGERREVSEIELRRIHAHKTGSLLGASLRFGAEAAGAPEARARRLERFGAELGLLFQVVDDLMNADAEASELGRPTGGDQRHAKATYLRLLGREGAHARRLRLHRKLHRSAGEFGAWSRLLSEAADYVNDRARERGAGGGR
jgi:geranylgeranyl pyrophosphate synthase